MKSKSKKICLLLAGGTAISDKDIQGSSVYKKEDIEGWFAQMPEVTLMATIELVFICADKELTGVSLWKKLSQEIFQRTNEFEGFVVLLDTESILNAGIALCFALENLNKPVILTGSQITEAVVKLPDWSARKSKAYGGLGVKSNLINAVQMTTMNLPAVALMFGNRIIRAVKARRSQALGLNLFESVDNKYLGKIDFGISLTEKFSQPQDHLKLENGFETNIKITEYFSGMDIKDLNKNDVKGKIIRDLPDLSLLDNYQGKVPIIVYNRHLFSAQKKEKIILINNMTWEAAVIKLMWALGQVDDYKAVGHLMAREYCFEFIKRE